MCKHVASSLLRAFSPRGLVTLVAAFCSISFAGQAAFAPQTLTLDTNLSTVQISLDALGKTDTQVPHLSGSAVVALDQLLNPTKGGLGDLQLRTIGTVNFKIDLSFLGKGTAQVTSFEVRRLNPPTDPILAALVGDSFSTADVPYQTAGKGSYKVTGAACSVLQGQGVPCTGDVDFGAAPSSTIGEVVTQLTPLPGQLRVTMSGFFSQPLDPTNPDIGQVSGKFNAVGFLPVEEPPIHVPLTVSQPSRDTLLVRWPKSGAAGVLFSAPGLAPEALWTVVAQDPVTNGQFIEVTLPIQPARAQRFLRLQ